MTMLGNIATEDAVCSLFPDSYFWIADLGFLSIGFSSNSEYLPGGRYVTTRPVTNEEFQSCAWRVHLHLRTALEADEICWLRQNSTRSFRGDRFRSGFYVTHHFGKPAYLFDYGRDIFVVGQELDKLIWPYFTKYILTVAAEDDAQLHLKAASLAFGDHGVLLIGRGSGGKTVFLTEACRRGASFVSNTHSVISGEDLATGVKSPLRVRKDQVFQADIERLNARQHIEADEFTLEPDELFQNVQQSVAVRSVVVVDYRPDRPREIVEISPDSIWGFAELFAFPTVTYGIKDDVLRWVEGDHFRFSRYLGSMVSRFRSLLARSSLYYVNLDVRANEDWNAFERVARLAT